MSLSSWDETAVDSCDVNGALCHYKLTRLQQFCYSYMWVTHNVWIQKIN